MTTTDAEDWFVDTNILIYATNAQSPWHQQATAALNDARQGGVNFVISPQILREYLVTATRPAPTPLLRSAEALENVEIYQKEFRVVADSPEVSASLVALVRRYGVLGKQVHDTNIVATMLTPPAQDPHHPGPLLPPLPNPPHREKRESDTKRPRMPSPSPGPGEGVRGGEGLGRGGSSETR